MSYVLRLLVHSDVLFHYGISRICYFYLIIFINSFEVALDLSDPTNVIHSVYNILKPGAMSVVYLPK